MIGGQYRAGVTEIMTHLPFWSTMLHALLSRLRVPQVIAVGMFGDRIDLMRVAID